jgi:hypothetical protein
MHKLIVTIKVRRYGSVAGQLIARSGRLDVFQYIVSNVFVKDGRTDSSKDVVCPQGMELGSDGGRRRITVKPDQVGNET